MELFFCREIRADLLRAHGEDPRQDRMYSEYKKCHAYKVVIFVSHGLDCGRKFILMSATGVGSASDGALFADLTQKLTTDVIPEAGGLGDAAFHLSRFLIAPYTPTQILAGGPDLKSFNFNHSSDRMTSEHGIRALKIWGAIRGRDDARMFVGDNLFHKVFTDCDRFTQLQIVRLPIVLIH